MSHQEIFNEIEKILQNAFKERLKRNLVDKNTYLEIENSEFYLRCNEIELTVGFGIIHNHFNDDYDNIELAIDRVFSLITNRIKIVDLIKGNKIYKKTIEIEHQNMSSEHFGSMTQFVLAFWKKEEERIQYFDKLIDAKEIKNEFEKLKSKNVC